MLVDKDIRNQNLVTRYVYCTLDVIASTSPQLSEQGNICMYTNPYICPYLYIFLYATIYISNKLSVT